MNDSIHRRIALHSIATAMRGAAFVAALALCASCATGPPATGTNDLVVHSPIHAAAEPHAEVEPAPWTSLAIDDAPEDFDFVIVSDRTGEHRPHVFRDAMPKIDLLRPAFVMSVGDLIEGYTEDRRQLEAEWDEFEGFLTELSMPFFHVPGNHDMSNDVMAEVWRERFGPSYYHFRYKGVLFLALNSELLSMVSKPGTPVGGPDDPAAQLAYVERVLADNRDARWTLVFVHQPFWDSPEIHPDWLKVEGWLGDRDYTVFAGHLHEYTLHRRNDRNYVTLATTGGGSPMRGVLHGEFDHVLHVSMREEGPVFANLDVTGVHDLAVRDEDLRETTRRLERAVRATTARFGGDRFTQGELRFDLFNDGDVPLRYEGDFVGNEVLGAQQTRFEGEIAPNSVEQVRVLVRAAQPTTFETLPPARIDWKLSSATRAGVPVTLDAQSSVAPERLFACDPTPDLEVDGQLDDWGVLALDATQPAVIEHASNVASERDASFRFDVRCSDEFAYIAVEVRDDSIVASPERVGREQDGVRITLDARNDPKRSETADGFFAAIMDGTFAQTLSLSAGPEPNPAFDSVFAQFVPAPPEGIRQGSARTANGYTVEFAVPVSVLDELRGERFDAFRLDLSVSDFDEDDVGHATLWWKPSRFSASAIPGSGTFVRGRR